MHLMMKLNVLLSRESEERISIRWDAGFLYTSGNRNHTEASFSESSSNPV